MPRGVSCQLPHARLFHDALNSVQRALSAGTSSCAQGAALQAQAGAEWARGSLQTGVGVLALPRAWLLGLGQVPRAHCQEAWPCPHCAQAEAKMPL